MTDNSNSDNENNSSINNNKRIYLSDYRAPHYRITTTDLHVTLLTDYTEVNSQLTIRKIGDHQQPLRLNGEALDLQSVQCDGTTLSPSDYTVTDTHLIIPALPAACVLSISVRIKPFENKTLSGLYESNGMYCTQCEAQGFRRITYYLDRPDALSEFTTTINADKSAYPVLLSNGNKIAEQTLSDNRHQVTWHDPHLKPCYLFALVAGDLACKEDHFITMHGDKVDLRFYVESKDLDKLDHGIASLKAAMTWDEEVYGRVYDLNNYMIVAVSHFNMGAMENKGLNIFNTSCVLADPDNATDAGYQRVEAVIAHEYFHNWSGNRVTCRDWFQLSLKEGFTVFRDAQFSADMNNDTVKRIEDVDFLRSMQFAEDAGPQAHPIRPASYIAIDNFYTLTVYEKGAEVIRMLHTLLGAEAFRKGSDLYFDRHDGSAATCDDFLLAMQDASGYDLTQFQHWYSQAGTPAVAVESHYDATQQTYTLSFSQSCPATPDQTDTAQEKAPFVIPIALALFNGAGGLLPLDLLPFDGDHPNLRKDSDTSAVFVLTEASQSLTFKAIEQAPIPSILRGFSAPVNLSYAYNPADYALLMQCETNGFNRWQAGQAWLEQIISAEIKSGEVLNKQRNDYMTALSRVLADKTVDTAVKAQMLALPTDTVLLEKQQPMRVQKTAQTLSRMKAFLGSALSMQLTALYHANQTGAYHADAQSIAKRSLKNAALSLLTATNTQEAWQLCQQQLDNADNLTDRLAALNAMVQGNYADKNTSFTQFYHAWQHEDLIIDKWFALQASNPNDTALDEVKALMQHPAFSLDNPNRVRSVVASFCRNNLSQFYREDGAGLQFLADVLRELDTINPQISARMAGYFNSWCKLPNAQQTRAQQIIEALLAADLSKNTYEILSNALNWQPH